MSFFRQNVPLFTGLSAGFLLSFMYWRMTQRILRELQLLSGTIVQLQTEVSEMKVKVEAATKRRKRPGSGFFSIHASSGEDDEDVYEEAYGGGSDLESLKELEEQIVVVPNTGEELTTDVPSAGTDTLTKPDIFAQVDKLLEGKNEDKEKALEILQNNKSLYLTEVEYFWRLSKTTYQVSQIEGARGKLDIKKQYIYTAKDLAYTAIGLDDTCANAHKWYAITIGSSGDYEGTQEKIKNGFIYKEHIEKAISIKPTDPSNHYLLGRWCLSVYMLSWLERKAAAALFATPPTATIDEALNHFLKAEELNPGKWKENMLFIAKCYIEKSQKQEAVKWLEEGKQIPVVSQDDKESEEEIVTLLAKHKG